LIALLKGIFEIFYEGCNRDVTIQVRTKLRKNFVDEIEPIFDFSFAAAAKKRKSHQLVN
jgi:hypothetical protein